MSGNRREYYRLNKKRINRDLKNTVNGVLCACFGAVALVLFFVGIGSSFVNAGAAGVLLGSMGLFGLVFALGAVALGFFALGEPKARRELPKLGTVLGIIMSIVYVVLYVVGAVAA